jgi:uridine phosphorylase
MAPPGADVYSALDRGGGMFPNYPGKRDEPALVEPAAYVDYLRAHGLAAEGTHPERAVLCYQSSLLDHLRRDLGLKAVAGMLDKYLYLVPDDPSLAVAGGFGIGAPVAVAIMEELVAMGCRRFVSIGTAGALQSAVAVGDLVVCDRAVRDEGTSHHYVRAAEYAYASSGLTERVKQALAELGRPFVTGAAWTTDAVYRETVSEARHYQRQGVLAVDMEAAALFAVAAYRRVEAAAMFTISDSLADLSWRPDFHRSEVRGGLEVMFAAARLSLG